ncbi:MAG: sporulation protein [Chloroflexota bacterium]
MTVVFHDSCHGVDWRLELDRDALLPGRLVAGKVSVVSHGTVDARALIVALRAIEHWQYEVTTTDANGHTSSHTETKREELVFEPVEVAGAIHLGRGETREWRFELPVPPLGPATLEARVAGLSWTVIAKFDVPGGLDSSIERPVRVLQPTALLRAGAVHVGAFAMYGAADVGADGVTGSVTVDPAPLCLGLPFHGTITLHSARARKLQEIRVEIRVRVKATVSSGLDETFTAWWGVIRADSLQGDRTIEIDGQLDGPSLPSIELPHSQTEATLHVILATAFAPDPHLIRDIAIATTQEL